MIAKAAKRKNGSPAYNPRPQTIARHREAICSTEGRPFWGERTDLMEPCTSLMVAVYVQAVADVNSARDYFSDEWISRYMDATDKTPEDIESERERAVVLAIRALLWMQSEANGSERGLSSVDVTRAIDVDHFAARKSVIDGLRRGLTGMGSATASDDDRRMAFEGDRAEAWRRCAAHIRHRWPLYSKPISALELSDTTADQCGVLIGARLRLEDAGVVRVIDLLAMTRRELLGISGIGRSGATKVVRLLKDNGLSLSKH